MIDQISFNSKIIKPEGSKKQVRTPQTTVSFNSSNQFTSIYKSNGFSDRMLLGFMGYAGVKTDLEIKEEEEEQKQLQLLITNPKAYLLSIVDKDGFRRYEEDEVNDIMKVYNPSDHIGLLPKLAKADSLVVTEGVVLNGGSTHPLSRKRKRPDVPPQIGKLCIIKTTQKRFSSAEIVEMLKIYKPQKHEPLFSELFDAKQNFSGFAMADILELYDPEKNGEILPLFADTKRYFGAIGVASVFFAYKSSIHSALLPVLLEEKHNYSGQEMGDILLAYKPEEHAEIMPELLNDNRSIQGFGLARILQAYKKKKHAEILPVLLTECRKFSFHEIAELLEACTPENKDTLIQLVKNAYGQKEITCKSILTELKKPKKSLFGLYT